VLERQFDSFGAQKQFALEQARGDWVLCLDADEWLDATARSSIAALVQHTAEEDVSGARIEMGVFYLGRRLRHGHWSGERKLRLVRRGRARWSPDAVHESLRLDSGRALDLSGHILHQPYRDLGHQMHKINCYTDLIAKRDASTPACRCWFGMLLEPTLVFLYGYLIRLGLLDGRQGFLAAATHAFYFFLRYAKIYQQGRNGGAAPEAEDGGG
jgi:glycosyltransferase involved in cell wall biosynthesis